MLTRMDLSSIPRPDNVSPTAIPVLIWDTASDRGDVNVHAALKAQGWEPVSMVLIPKPRGVLGANGNGVADNEYIFLWGFKRVVNVLWVEATEQKDEQASA